MDNLIGIYLGIGFAYAIVEVILNELSVFVATEMKEEYTDEWKIILKHEDGAKLLVDLIAGDKFAKPWGIIHRIGIDIFAWPFEMIDQVIIASKVVTRMTKKDS